MLFRSESWKMSEIKKGDWVEVVNPSEYDALDGVSTGDKFKVSFVSPDGSVKVHFGADKYRWHGSADVVKVDAPTVNEKRPASNHYQNANGNDVWQFMDDNFEIERVKGFHQGNALKYITRYSVKHDEPEKRIEDLRKAKVYIDKLIELEQTK